MLPLQLVRRYGDCARFGAFHPSSSASQLMPSPFVSDLRLLRTPVFPREARYLCADVGAWSYSRPVYCPGYCYWPLLIAFLALPSDDQKDIRKSITRLTI